MGLKTQLNIYTKLAPDQRAKILRWLSKQNKEVILLAFEKQKVQLFKLNNIKEENRSILYLSAMYMAINELYQTSRSSLSKNRSGDLMNIQNVTNLQIKQFKKDHDSQKIDRLLNLKGKLITLKNDEKMSYRDIAKFLKKFHRLDISHTTIHTFFKSIIESQS